MSAVTDAVILTAYLVAGAGKLIGRYRLRFILWRSTWKHTGTVI
jgi:hypothetical protein